MPGRFEPFRFAVITDPHLADAPAEASRAKFERAIADINAQEDIAFVLCLGDLLWPGPMEDLRRLLETIRPPLHLVPGNGDWPRTAEYEAAFGPPYHAFEHNGCLFVGLWTTQRSGAHVGELGVRQEGWLVDTLAEAGRAGTQRIFVYAHVPPPPPGSPTDPQLRIVPDLARRLYDLFSMRGVGACFFGHIHQNEVFEHRNIKFISTPSVNWNFDTRFGYLMRDWVKADFGGYRVVRVDRRGVADDLRWLHGR